MSLLFWLSNNFLYCVCKDLKWYQDDTLSSSTSSFPITRQPVTISIFWWEIIIHSLGKNTLSKGLSFIRFWSCITQFLTLNYFLIPSWSDPYKKLHDKTTVNIVWKGEELARYPEWKMKSYHDSKKCKARSKSEKKHMGINKMQNSA